MSSHQLAIAKASFSAGLLRPDPTSISRDEIAHFHSLLNSLATECSPANVQASKRWILCNVLPSTARFAAFGKYLVALSISFSGLAKSSESTKPRREPSGKRKRLHLLFLVNDLLYHAKYHDKDPTVASKVQPSLFGLFNSAASFRNSLKHQQKIENLLNIWEEKQYLSTEYIGKLRQAVKIAPDSGRPLETAECLGQQGEIYGGLRPYKNVPFTMPAVHGDQGTPWYDLPAGNLIPHIIPNSTRPINPNLVKPLRFAAGPADELLTNAVRNLLSDVDNIFGAMQGQHQCQDNICDIDELGQELLRDEETGEPRGSGGYYGWSKAFCDRMSKYREKIKDPRAERYPGDEAISQSRSTSRGSSRRSRRLKRRRYSDSEEERSISRSNSRSRFIRRSHSSSQSPHRGRSSSYQRDGQSRVSRESTPQSKPRDIESRDVLELSSMSGSRHFQPDQPPRDSLRDSDRDSLHPSYLHEQDIQTIQHTPYSQLPPPNLHFTPGVIPIPPPPPPQYQGQWPPLPPPPPPSIQSYDQQAQYNGAWPAPPPPFLRGAQNWQPKPYAPFNVGSNPWTPTPPQGRNGAAHENGGRGGPGLSQPPYQGDGKTYNGYRGNGRGRGWS